MLRFMLKTNSQVLHLAPPTDFVPRFSVSAKIATRIIGIVIGVGGAT